ncbi:MAG TPA: hypothetical protein VK254_03620 [Candidatus Bathyarchaeia archaeon]|nr:hypothetical protein [Candidatus Bathyarchaeia archaeon]
MSSKIIIIAAIILITVSFSVLFVIEAKNHSYDYKKSWSVAYFENPRDDSLDFAIENHEGQNAEYGYKIFINDDKVIDEKVEINAGAKQEISPVIPSEKLSGNKVLIDVNYKGTDYKIYKNVGK